MKVPFLDLKAQYQTIKEEIMSVTQEVYDSQRFILGARVEEFENAMATYCDTG